MDECPVTSRHFASKSMGKLRTIAPRIGALAPRLGRAPGDEKARLRERDQSTEWRSWYGTERWKKLRRQVWARDHYRCQKTGVLCIGKYPAENSPVADHKIAHRGNGASRQGEADRVHQVRIHARVVDPAAEAVDGVEDEARCCLSLDARHSRQHDDSDMTPPSL